MEYHILNLGAGVQSTTIYLMVLNGDLNIPLDCAVFADTQDEPEAVYEHLEWLKTLGGPPIVVRTNGRLGDDLIKGQNSTGQRFAAIPAYTRLRGGDDVGMVRRQCTKEYKVEVIERYVRRELIGLKPRQRMPSDVKVHHYMGFSFDEPGRAARTRLRFKQLRWGEVYFPLFDEQMTRLDCRHYLEEFGVPHETPRSACVFCPFHSNREWAEIKKIPADWERAVEVDEGLRTTGACANRDLNAELYVHRSGRPLKDANLDEDQLTLFDQECEGGCGL